MIFLLITYSLTTLFGQLHPTWTIAWRVGFGIATSVLLFGSVLLHELGHSVVALKYRIPVRSITLFVFGGIAQIDREPDRLTHELAIAIAGPIVSALLGALFYVVRWLTQGTLEGVASLSNWLGGINVALAVFNLVPGFPLDGGRVLRAIAWRMTDSYERATAIATGAGQFFAYAFILMGMAQALAGNVLGGLWIAFIGWFLLTAAQASSVQLRLRYTLEGIAVRDVMHHEWWRVGGDVTVTPLRDIMVTEGKLSWVAPDAPVATVLQRMNEADVSQIPVIENGALLGVVGRDRVLTLVDT